MDTERVTIEFAGRKLVAVRCTPADYLALADWSDMHLGRDYFFRRGHVEKVLGRDHNQVYAFEIDDVMGGFMILYNGSVLHNLYLQPEYRHTGIGSAILQHFNPSRIRSKTNMLAGDPTDFYKANGYVVDQPDPARPHILDMVRPGNEEGQQAAAALAASAYVDDAQRQPVPEPPSSFTFCGCWAVGVGPAGFDAAASPGSVATPTPTAAGVIANRERARQYRLRKKASLAAARPHAEQNGQLTNGHAH